MSNTKNIYKKTHDFFEKHIDKKAEDIRAEKAEYHAQQDYHNDPKHNGSNGIRFEYECHSSRAKRTDVGKNPNDDITVYIDIGGGYCRAEKAECKTGGGRVNHIMDAVNRGEDFIVIYELNIKNSTTGNKFIYHKAVYLYASEFIKMLTECNALKTIYKKHEYDGIGIQPSSRKLWKALDRYPTYEKNTFLYDDGYYIE